MTREEEIRQKANELYYTHSPYEATIAMAEWADSHSRKGLVDIEKVCEWLHKLLDKQGYIDYDDLIDCKEALEKGE